MADAGEGGGDAGATEDYTAEEVSVDDSPAYAGLADVVELFTSYNVILDSTAAKLDIVSAKLDTVIEKLSQIDTGEGGGASTGGGETPVGGTEL